MALKRYSDNNQRQYDKILKIIWENTDITLEKFIALEIKLKGYSTSKRRLFIDAEEPLIPHHNQ